MQKFINFKEEKIVVAKSIKFLKDKSEYDYKYIKNLILDIKNQKRTFS